MRQRGNTLIGVLVGLLIAGGLFGAYYLGLTKNSLPQVTPNLGQSPNLSTQSQITPQPTNSDQTSISKGVDETANWKIFTEPSLNLTFKYPADWIAAKSPGSDLYITLTDDPKDEKGFVPMQISIYSLTDDKGQDLHIGSIQEAKADILKSFKNDAEVRENLLIGGKPGLSVKGSPLGGPGFEGGDFLQLTLVQLDNKIIEVQLGKKSIESTFSKILSTFKFTK